MNKLLYLGLILLFLGACETSPYKRMKEKELARGIRIDSMPFGLKLGDSKKDFFAKCWELNKTGEILAGPGNEYARHYMEPKEENGKRIDMLFYGIFDDENKMTGFKMRLSYTGWAPWAEGYQAEDLKEAIEDTLMKWYPGNDFLDVDLKKDDMFASYKIEGNLEFKLIKIDDRQIAVRIEDITAP